MAKVVGLTVYPVKGCKGIELTSATCTPTGLLFDRQWVVVSEGSGRFITQRQISKLCQVSVALPPEALVGGWGKLQPGAAMVLSAPGMPQLQVPLPDPSMPAGKIIRVTVWEFTGNAADEGDEAAAWFSSFLGKPARLARHLGSSHAAAVPDTVRPTDPEFAPGHSVQFADGFPLLVAMQENLDDLNARLAGAPLPANRFRANIMLSGAPGGAWSDDGWRGAAFGGEGGAAVGFAKPCSRCGVTTVDQETGEQGDEPLKILGTFRSGKVLGWNEQHKSWTHAVFWGWNAVVERQGIVRVGDAVTVVPR